MADISDCFLAFLYLRLPFLFFFPFLFSAVIQRTNGIRFLFDDSGPTTAEIAMGFGSEVELRCYFLQQDTISAVFRY